MFWNIFKKYILCSIRSKEMVIWTLAFPILLSTLFYFAFSSLDKGEMLEQIPVAVVEDQAYKAEPFFSVMMEALTAGEDPFLEASYVKTEEDADALLKADEVDGYITMKEGEPSLSVKKTGISQTVLKNILDRYIQTKDGIVAAVKKNPESAGKFMELGEDLFMESNAGIEQINFSGNEPSSTVNYFYSLLAMVCLFGAFHGQMIIMTMQANLSPLGARKTISPQNRGKIFGASFLAAFAVQFFCVTVALCYIQFVLKISFGGQFWYALLTCFVGSLVGISFGCVISLPSKWKYAMKTAIMVAGSLTCCFFAGMMVGGINYIVEENAPVLAMLNPAARIADAFYCLYYYDNHRRYFQNIGILVVMAALLFMVAMVCSRRKEYESI